MGDGVTTGQQLNSLLRTRVNMKAANRGKGTGGTYTRLSRQYNGFLPNVSTNYARDHKCCNGGYNDTMMKLQQGMYIAQQAGQLFNTFGSLIGGNKSVQNNSNVQNTNVVQNTDLGALDKQIQEQATNIFDKNYSPTVNSDLSATLDALSLDIDFANVDYESMANDFLDQMGDAKSSQDLYTALVSAKNYKTQISARLSTMPSVDDLKTQLQTLEGKADGSIDKAEQNVNTAEGNAKKAESDFTNSKEKLKSARDSYDSARNVLNTDEANYNVLNKEVSNKTTAYDKAVKELGVAQKNLSAAENTVRDCTSSHEAAKANTAQAKSNLDALIAQRGTNDSPQLEAQISAAETAFKQAEEAEKAAEKRLADANKQKEEANEALNGNNGAKKACETAKDNLTTARNNLKDAANKLVESKKLTQEQADLIVNRANSLDQSEQYLEQQQENVVNTSAALEKAKDDLQALKDKKQTIEIQLGDIQEMKKVVNEKLTDKKFADYEKKLDEMMAKEKTDYNKLNSQLKTQNKISNDDGESSKKRKNAEGKETDITKKMVALNNGDASDDIARTNAMRSIGSSLSGMQNDATISIGGVNVKKCADGKYEIEGQKLDYKDAVQKLIPASVNSVKFTGSITANGASLGLFGSSTATNVDVNSMTNMEILNVLHGFAEGQSETINGHTVLKVSDTQFKVDGKDVAVGNLVNALKA